MLFYYKNTLKPTENPVPDSVEHYYELRIFVFVTKEEHKATNMADHKLPEKQWAQVIEKTGGPVEYKGPCHPPIACRK